VTKSTAGKEKNKLLYSIYPILPMIVFPNCKINLGLHVLEKRNDGYHNLETVFFPVPVTDALEIVAYNEPGSNTSLKFSQSGLTIEGDVSLNSCQKAYNLLKKDFPGLPALQMHLHKVIPHGAGLGGGSADGAFTFLLLNDMFSLGISREKLIEYAGVIGSDCPFFIINKPCIAFSKGEKLSELKIELKNYKLLLIYPGIYVKTAEMYREIKPNVSHKPLVEIITKPVESWRNELENDFEKVVFLLYPEIANLKESLYKQGAVYASMSGSGSSVYGLFEKDCILELNYPGHYFVRELILD